VKREVSRRARRSLIPRPAAALLIGLAWSARPALCQNPSEIHEAVKKHDLGKVKALVESDASLVLAKDKDGATPLHLASRKDIAELLLSNKADVNAKDNDGATPLHWIAALNYPVQIKEGRVVALYQDPLEVARLLLANGAEVHANDRKGQTPLHWAADVEVTKLLLASGAEVNARDSYGRTPLHTAALHDHEYAANLMLGSGATVNAKDNDGGTALHLAALMGHQGPAKLLLANGADVNAKDNNGFTPLRQEIEVMGRVNPKAMTVELITDSAALVELLRSKDWYIRQAAAIGLARVVRALRIRGLGPGVNYYAVVLPQAAEPLITSLKDPDWHVRATAAVALGEIMDPRALEPLINATKDPDWRVREDAAMAVAEISRRGPGPWAPEGNTFMLSVLREHGGHP
jgi:hypothetical protein